MKKEAKVLFADDDVYTENKRIYKQIIRVNGSLTRLLDTKHVCVKINCIFIHQHQTVRNQNKDTVIIYNHIKLLKT